MSEQVNSDAKLKGETWVHFITLIQLAGEKKASEKAKQKERNLVATATDDVHCKRRFWRGVMIVVFFEQLTARSDVYESPYFLPELINVLNQLIHYRNVTFFNLFTTRFLPVYLKYL